MKLTVQQIAEAFSRHDFASTYPYLAPDIRWIIIGGDQVEGRQAVMQLCEQSASYLATVSTRFSKFRVIRGEDCVVIDSLATYLASDEPPSTVASCDIYQFADGNIFEITSYTVELKP